MIPYVKVAGVWVPCQPWVRNGGVWKRTVSAVRVAGVWEGQEIFNTDFAEYPTGSAPADWTAQDTSAGSGSIVAATGSISGKAFQFTNLNSGSGRIIYSWNIVPSTADVEILARGRQMTPGDTKPITGLFGRGSSLNIANSNYYREETRYRTASANDTLVMSIKSVAGSGGTIAQADGPAPLYSGSSPTPWLWNRLRINGTTIQAKSWQDGSAEPGTWLLSNTDTGLATAGLVGAMFTATTAVPVIQMDFFSVGLNGKTALGP